MNDRTEFSAALGAMVLAVATPAMALAQDQATPEMTTPVYDNAPAAVSAADQLDRLQSLGFLNQSQVLSASVDGGSPIKAGFLPSDQLYAALDNVRVADADGVTFTLREFLDSQGITPDSIAGINVSDNGVVVIAHT